jgi:hypothetical protein
MHLYLMFKIYIKDEQGDVHFYLILSLLIFYEATKKHVIQYSFSFQFLIQRMKHSIFLLKNHSHLDNMK